MDINKRFLENRDETGRFIYKSLITGKTYYIEPISNGRPADWGSYNPATGNIEHKKGYDKHTGSIKPEDSLITENNGFKLIEILEEGESPLSVIEKRDKEYQVLMGTVI